MITMTFSVEDAGRIFQALAQETQRLSDLPVQWASQESVDHCARLRDKFASVSRWAGATPL